MIVDIREDVRPWMGNFRAFAQQIDPRIGQAVAELIRAHLFAKGPNKMGWPSTGFNAAAARSTTWHLTGTGVLIGIYKQGFRLRLEGGVVKPVNISETTGKPIKYLTIPARSEAYGKRAGEFGNLKVLWGKKGPFALIADEGGATRKIFQGREDTRPERKIRGANEGLVLFWLVKEARYNPDPTMLPTEQQILDTALKTAQDALQLLTARSR